MKIFVVDDDATDRQKLKEAFDSYDVAEADNLQAAAASLEAAAQQHAWPELVVLDAVFPQKAHAAPDFMAGRLLGVLEELGDRRGQEFPDVILVSGQREAAEQFDTIAEWLDTGKLRDVLPKSIADVGWRVFQAILRHKVGQLQRERELRAAVATNEVFASLDSHGLITCDASMIRVWASICRAARTKHNVFIQGETGTGKELVARAIARIQRRNIVSVNCGAIPAELFEAEFFGTVPGAFNGALNKAGLVEIAGNGILFCDEAGKLLPRHQMALLHVTDAKNRHYRRVGETTRAREAACQFVFATAEPISEEVAAGRFSAELASRLTRLVIELPPLRERRADIRLITSHFLKEGNQVQQKRLQLTEEVYRVFEQAPWPGNVRKLEDFVGNLVESDYHGVVTLDMVRAAISEQEFHRQLGQPGMIAINPTLERRSPDLSIPLDPAQLLDKLREEPETWVELGREMHAEGTRRENEHEPVVIAALSSLLNETGHKLLADCRSALEARDGNNPRRMNVYKALLYLALRPQHMATLTDFGRILKLDAWESCRKVADTLVESFGPDESAPAVERRVEKENHNRKVYRLTDAVL